MQSLAVAGLIVKNRGSPVHSVATAGPPLVLHVFPTFAVGGAQVRFAAVANRFGRDWRHCVVAMDGNLACRERLSPTLNISFPEIVPRKGDIIGNVRRFRQTLRDWRPHVLVTSNWGTIEWAMANMPSLVRHVHTEDGLGPDEWSSQFRRRVWTRRFILRRSTVVVPSRKLADTARETWNIDDQRIAYVPNGVDLKRFHASNSRCIRWPVPGPVIGTVAALRPEKNLARLLRAFSQVASTTAARLIVAGDGAERSGLIELARNLGVADRVHFTGHVARTEDLYASFDIFALSSDTEQMPFSVLEAMASGLPVVSTDVGDVRAMVATENQHFVVPLEDCALTEGLQTLILDPALARRVGAANQEKAVRNFDQEQMFTAHAELWRGPQVKSV